MKFLLWSQSTNSFIQMRRMNLLCTIFKRKEIISLIVFIPIERETLILKMVKREVFLMRPKHQCHLSQLGEWVYDSQSWKERRLLCESVFIQIDKRTLILKNYGKNSFSDETKASMSFFPIRRMSLWFAIMKKKEIIMWIHVYANWQTNFDSKKFWEEQLFW